jgi:bacillithiol biosynthesis cysteine-adding enzyme BshC
VGSVAADYISGNEGIARFFAGSPHALLASPPQLNAWDETFAEGMRDYQVELGLTRKLSGNEAVIITGQQPGIFTGPLYTIYKAATAIRLAARLRETYGVPCVPVFWVGSEDHDFDEAKSAHFLSKHHEPFTLEYAPSADVAGFPMCRVPIEPSLHDLVDRAAANTSGSEYRDEVARVLHETLERSSSIAEWAARLMAHLFRDTDLLLFSPHLEFARNASLPILRKEISEPLASNRLVIEGGKQLAALGYAPQLVRNEQDCSFFLEVENRRRKVTFSGGTFHVNDTELAYPPDAMLALLESAPTRFSPNVALRCVVQQHLFAPAAYVAGPGEVAYWAQLKTVFEHFGHAIPIVYPRARAVLSTIKLNKLRRRAGLEYADLEQPFDVLLERVLESLSDSAALAAVRERRAEFRGVVDSLAAALESRDKRLTSYIPSLRERIDFELDRLERAILRADETKVETAKQQLTRLCNAFAPWRRPQERVYTLFTYLFEHGWGLVGRITNGIDVETFGTTEFEL